MLLLLSVFLCDLVIIGHKVTKEDFVYSICFFHRGVCESILIVKLWGRCPQKSGRLFVHFLNTTCSQRLALPAGRRADSLSKRKQTQSQKHAEKRGTYQRSAARCVGLQPFQPSTDSDEKSLTRSYHFSILARAVGAKTSDIP